MAWLCKALHEEVDATSADALVDCVKVILEGAEDQAVEMVVEADIEKLNEELCMQSDSVEKKDEMALKYMKVGQHYYSTLLYLRMRAFGALTGV